MTISIDESALCERSTRGTGPDSSTDLYGRGPMVLPSSNTPPAVITVILCNFDHGSWAASNIVPEAAGIEELRV